MSIFIIWESGPLSSEEWFLADQEPFVAIALDLYNSCIPFHGCCQRSRKLNKVGSVPQNHPPLNLQGDSQNKRVVYQKLNNSKNIIEISKAINTYYEHWATHRQQFSKGTRQVPPLSGRNYLFDIGAKAQVTNNMKLINN